MGTFTRVFCISVIVADLFALVYFSGHYLITGHFLPHNEAPYLVLAPAEDAGDNKARVVKASAKVEDLSNFVANAEEGRKIANSCRTCHTFDQGGAQRTGPNLWGIFGKGIAAIDSFSYSKAFKEKKGQIVWDDAALDGFLKKPRKFTPGTKMAFPGVRSEKDRLHLIAWLKTLQ